MINNAIDMFNLLNDSVAFVEDAVRHLRQSLRDGAIMHGEGVALTDDDVASVGRSNRDVRAQMAAVRTDLLLLKQFYSH